ncbi:MAG: hypothetical protein RLZZ385_423 [Pseudomonadota bacterium]
MIETFVIYLHGFLSSPQSNKARQVVRYCQDHGLDERLAVPALTGSPQHCVSEVQRIIDQHGHQQVALIGSSLGGFYATCLAQRNSLRAAVINPAVRPQDYWRNYLGEHRNYYSDSVHVVTEQHVLELAELDPPELSRPDDFLLLVQTGDEVLDYRRAVTRYQGATQIVQPGGDHSFRNFESQLPTVFEFLTIQN